VFVTMTHMIHSAHDMNCPNKSRTDLKHFDRFIE